MPWIALAWTPAGAGAQSAAGAAAEAEITAPEVRGIVEVLAADSLEGREAGTDGADRAARFVARRFLEIGLDPPGRAGRGAAVASGRAAGAEAYLQPFDLPPRIEAGPRTRLFLAVDVAAAGASADRLAFAPPEVAPFPFSSAGEAAGPLVVVPPAGAFAGPNAPQLRGAIALLGGVSNPAGLRRRVEELEGAGAAGVLLLVEPATMPRSAGGALGVPVLAVGHAAAERLAEASGLDLLAVAHGAAPQPAKPATVQLTADLRHSPRATANVVGVLPGTDPALSAEAIVVGAHYDHLGWGGPGSLAPDVRAVHNGADDNASGVAGLLELAERFAARPPARTLVFAAFGAEEEGLLGSQGYVRSPTWPLERTVAMLNLDMVGRLRERLTVYGTGTSPQWPAVLDEAAGDLPLSRIPDGLGPSDHATFYAAGVPVLALFTGAHEDYHRPDDDAERVDAEGEVRVLRFAARVLERVAGPGARIAFAEAPVTRPQPRGFQVALGTMPDYGYAGPGLRLSAVRPGGPAERAGLRSGDVVVRLAGRDVGDLYAYTAVLADLEAGAEVELVYVRNGEERVTTVTPEPR